MENKNEQQKEADEVTEYNPYRMFTMNINRNGGTFIEVWISKKLADKLKENGKIADISKMKNDRYRDNWDLSDDAKVLCIDFKEFNTDFENIIGEDEGINWDIIRLACVSENRRHKVKYNGLISTEALERYGKQFIENFNIFINEYLTNVSIELILNYRK